MLLRDARHRGEEEADAGAAMGERWIDTDELPMRVERMRAQPIETALSSLHAHQVETIRDLSSGIEWRSVGMAMTRKKRKKRRRNSRAGGRERGRDPRHLPFHVVRPHLRDAFDERLPRRPFDREQ